MTSLGDITVGFRADTSSLMAGFNMLKQGIGGVPGLALLAGAAVIGFGAKTVQMAGAYQESMDMVQALTGATTAQMDQYDASLKNLAINAGVAPTALAKGLYNVLSAGYAGAQAMQVLTLATEDAKIGMTDSAITSNALTVALRAFNVPASQFVTVNGEMLRTVTAGKMTMSDYASAISKTSSVAVQFHDSMSDMNAVLATLTSSGIKNANVAGTDYNNLLKVLNGNTDKMTKAIHQFDPAFSQAGFAALSMRDKVKELNTILTEHGKNFSDVVGKQQNAAAAYTMLSTHMDTYTSNLANLSNMQQNASATQSAWAITQSGFNQTMSRAGAAVQVLMINIGSKLLPVLTQLVGAFTAQVLPALQLFGGWIQQNVLPILQKFGQWFQANAMPALQQFATIIQQNVVPVIQNLVTIIGDALGWIKDHWTQIWGVIGPILRAVWDVVTGIIKIGWSIISGIFNVALDLIQGKWGKVWTDIKNMLGGIFDGIGSMAHGFVELIGAEFNWLGTLLHGIWDGIVGIIKASINLVIGLIDDFIGGIDSIGIDIGPVHVHPNIGKIPFLAGGGIVGPGQSFIAGERGAELITAGTNGASVAPLSAGGGGSQLIQIFLDSELIGEAAGHWMTKHIRLKGGLKR